MSFLITYYSAFDRNLLRTLKGTDYTLQPITETLIAPSNWTPTEVSEAFLRHHPGIQLVACLKQP